MDPDPHCLVNPLDKINNSNYVISLVESLVLAVLHNAHEEEGAEPAGPGQHQPTLRHLTSEQDAPYYSHIWVKKTGFIWYK